MTNPAALAIPIEDDDDDESPVLSMKDFFQDVLREAAEVDARLHRAIAHVRERVYALTLAEDPAFRRALRDFGAELGGGQLPKTLTLDEFRDKYATVQVAGEPYPLSGGDAWDDWLAKHEGDLDAPLRQAVRDLLIAIMEDPDEVGGATVPSTGLPVYAKTVDGTKTIVSYCVIKSPPYDKDLRQIRLVRIEDLQLRLNPHFATAAYFLGGGLFIASQTRAGEWSWWVWVAWNVVGAVIFTVWSRRERKRVERESVDR